MLPGRKLPKTLFRLTWLIYRSKGTVIIPETIYHNDHMFFNRRVWANSVDPEGTVRYRSTLFACVLLDTLLYVNFRIISALSGVRSFRISLLHHSAFLQV